MSGEILFLAHRLPFPPDRGDRIRSTHVLRALAQIAPVHVGCFVDSVDDRAHLPALADIAASTCVEMRKTSLPMAGLAALRRGEPVSLAAYRSARLSVWVETLLASGRIGAVYVFSGQMGQFIPASWTGRLVVDLCDVDSAKFDAYAANSGFPLSWVHRREGRLLAQVEGDLAARADHTLLVSDAEAALLASRTSRARHIRSLGNGIDARHFMPDVTGRCAEMIGPGPHLLFTGQMDYPPNVAAVERMAHAIMPLVRQVLPNAGFHVAGRAPTRAVLALAGVNGTHVHGAVPDMRPLLNAADMVVAPLTIARGVQNKVLEAMAMARSVVLSPQAATGIAAHDGEHFAIAADDAAFAETLVRLANDRAAAVRMGEAARAFVLAQQSWAAMLADLPQLLGFAGGQAGGQVDQRNAA